MDGYDSNKIVAEAGFAARGRAFRNGRGSIPNAEDLEVAAARMLARAERLRSFAEPKRGSRYELKIRFAGNSRTYRYLALRVKGKWFITGRANENYATWDELFNGWNDVAELETTALRKANS